MGTQQGGGREGGKGGGREKGRGRGRERETAWRPTPGKVGSCECVRR